MKELKGVWWTINQEPVPGTLVITDENKILLTTYEKLNDTNIINGFAEHQRITLVDTELERTQIYYKPEEENEREDVSKEPSEEIKYYTYTYIAQLAVLGHDYKRKGSIRVESLELKYTNLDEWVNWKTELPIVKNTKQNITFKFEKIPDKRAKLGPFDLVVEKPYFLTQSPFDMKIQSDTDIFIDNIQNKYINSLQGIINCIQSFLVLCTGENIDVEKIKAVDFYGRDIELILGYGKSNYENTSILKNIIKFQDIMENLQTVLENWLKLYIDNELLVTNFVNLQRREEPLISEYTNLMSAIDSLYLVITKQNKTNEPFAEILKRLLRETNFILNLSEDEINELANNVKDIRRYFIHSNKTQKDLVNENIPAVIDIVIFLVEVIRARIMLEIGIDKKPIEEYYAKMEQMKKLKIKIVNNRNQEVMPGRTMNKEDKRMRVLSKEDKENIAELNAIMGTRYREANYDQENTKDLIELVTYTTAEYMDYVHYSSALEYVIENFDQSLEVFYPEKWVKVTKDGTTGSEIINETISSLNDASDNMYILESDAKDRCREIWNFLLLGNNEEAKEYFLGDTSKYTKEQLLDALEKTIDNIGEIEHQNQVETDAKNFGEEIKRYLELEIK